MFECRKYRIEIARCASDHFHVHIRPVEYVDDEEFKAYMALCRRNFMTLTEKWAWSRVFPSHIEATVFAKHLTRQLGELVFLDLNQIQIATPKET